MLQNLMLISVTLGGIFLIVMTIMKSRGRTDLIKKLSNPGFLDSEGVLIPEYAPQFVRHSELTEGTPYSRQQVEGMLSRASELHPDHPELSIAWAYFQPERALSTLNRAIEKHPENLELRLARLKAYDDTVDPRKLEAEAREIAELPGGDTEGQFALAEVYVRIGRPERAVRVVEDRSPIRWFRALGARGRNSLGQLYLELDRKEEAGEVAALLQESPEWVENMVGQRLAEKLEAQ